MYNYNNFRSVAYTILIGVFSVLIDVALLKYKPAYHGIVMLTFFFIVAIRNRNQLGRFLGVVIFNMLCWQATYKYEPYVNSRIAGYYLSPLDMATIIIFLIWVYKIFNRKQLGDAEDVVSEYKLSIFFWLIMVAFIIAAIIGSFSGATLKEILRDSKIIVIYLIYFPLRGMLKKEDNDHLFSVLLIILVMSSIVSINSALFFEKKQFDESYYIISSRLTHNIPKTTGIIDSTIFPVIAWGLIMAINLPKYRKSFIFLSFLLFISAITSFSRAITIGNISTFVIVLLIYFFSLRNTPLYGNFRKVLYNGAIIFIIAIIAAYPIINQYLIANIDRVLSIFGIGYGVTGMNIDNMNARSYAMQYGLNFALDNPLGGGFGGQNMNKADFYGGDRLMGLMYHSLPLSLLYTFGLIGGAMIFFSWIAILVKAYKKVIQNDGFNSMGACIIFTYMVYQLVVGFGGNTLLRTDTLFGIACGILETFLSNIADKSTS